VKRALLDGLVDLRDQLLVLGGDRLGVAALDRALEPAEVRLSRFSARSRSLRRIRFFCEAMLAIS
jgi:hypothetical protein